MDELIRLFNENGVKYLLIGGQAVRLMGMPRFSMDWDIFIPGRDLDSIAKINALLGDHLDMELLPLGDRGQNFIQTFQTIHGIIQFHLAPVGLPSFDEAERRSEVFELESGVSARTLCRHDMLQCKLKTGRPKDEDDVAFLRHLCQ